MDEIYSIMISQGNTTDAGDCAKIFEGFSNISNYDNQKYNRGWSYNDGKYSVSEIRAGATCFVEAGDKDVLYWSGHGGKNSTNGPNLNVNASTTSGQRSAFNVPKTLKIADSKNRYIPDNNIWKNKALKVVVLAACHQLDAISNGALWYARAMQSSNVRVITGYHESGPTHPNDIEIARLFMKYAKEGHSVRYAWQLANANYAKTRWATLVYHDADNQYFRFPGFPGRTYLPPIDKTVYRYRERTDEPVVEPILGEVPIALTISGANCFQEKDMTRTIRDICFPSSLNSRLDRANRTADQFLRSARIKPEDYYLNSSTIVAEQVCDKSGRGITDQNTDISRIFTYYKHSNLIRMNDDYIRIAVNAEGLYFVMDKRRHKKLIPERVLNFDKIKADCLQAFTNNLKTEFEITDIFYERYLDEYNLILELMIDQKYVKYNAALKALED